MFRFIELFDGTPDNFFISETIAGPFEATGDQLISKYYHTKNLQGEVFRVP
jgi:hypothetical protein